MIIQKAFNHPAFPQFVSEMGYNGPEDWNKAGLKVLMVFPSDITVRTVSSTQYYMYNIIKQNFGDDVFCDISFKPLPQQETLHYKHFPPLMGSFSKRTWEDFDIILLSIAITMSEFAEAYKLLHAAKFPIKHKDRLNDDRTPFLVMGGVAADNATALDSIVDMVNHGLGERALPRLIKAAHEVQQERGSVAKGKWQLIQKLKDYEGFIYPSAYRYHMDTSKGYIEHELTDVMEGFPSVTQPDMDLPIDKYGHFGDQQWYWPNPGNQRKTSMLSAWGCSGGTGVCNFCHEGALYGAWRERSIESLKKGLVQAKMSSMGETFSYYSFNANFHSHFVESLKIAYPVYSKISVLNFRQDALAAQPDYLNLLKALGAISISGAVEGFGERIRNGILNKNLTFSDMKIVAKRVFELRFLRFKNGFIETGYETKEDWEEGFDEIRQILDLRDQANSNARYQINVTSLVHNAGTALYYKPRVMSLDSWHKAFDPNYYRYPFFPLTDMGVKVKLSSRKGDTFVQQLLEDSGRLGEELILKPALDNKVMSKEYLLAVKAKVEQLGLDPKKQFLDFNPLKSPHQHMRISRHDSIIRNDPEYFNHSHEMCLRTPATIYKGITNTCVGCGQCAAIDKCRKEEGLTVETPHMQQMLKREVFTKFDVRDIMTMKIQQAASFYYQMIFYVKDGPARYISNENLTRRWLSKAASVFGEDFAMSFRKFDYSNFQYLEYDGYIANYTGLEIVTAAFRDKLPENFDEKIEEINGMCEAISLVKWAPQQTSGRPKYKALFELNLKIPFEEVNIVMNLFKEKPFRVYESGVYEEINLPFDYKLVKRGDFYSVFMIVTPTANPMYTLLAKYQFNALFDKVTMDVKGLFMTDNSGTLYNLVNGKVQPTAGFIHVDKEEEERIMADDDEMDAAPMDDD